MHPATTNRTTDRVDLSALIDAMTGELRCLLGPGIELAVGTLSAGSAAWVRLPHCAIVELLRHLALDAHDAMPAGGSVTIYSGCLPDAMDCPALMIHEKPATATSEKAVAGERIRKGRSLGLGAAYDVIERVAGHFHVSCRGRETVLTICFPLAG